MSLEERVYRRLLALACSRRVGARAREEMVEVFLDLRERARRGSPARRILFWLRMFADLVWTGVAERAGWWAAGGGHAVDERRGGTMRRGRWKGAGRPLGAAGFGQALKAVIRRPGRSLVAAVTLGLGVGAGTLVAVLARDVLLAPLPYEEGSRLVRLRELDEDRRPWWPSRLNFEEWRAAGAPGVEGIEAIAVPSSLPVLFQGRAVRAEVAEASVGFFSLVGAGTVRGRKPTESEWGRGGRPVAVVSHAFWEHELGRRTLDDETLLVGAEVLPVVGVLEPGFGFMGDGGAWSRPDVWIPMERNPNQQARQSHGIHVVARIADGVDLERADRGLDVMAAGVAETHGEPTHAHSVLTTSLEDDLLGAARRPLTLLLFAAGGVLLIVGLNLAGAFLVDGLGRVRELHVRRALGAGRLHIVGQLLAEASLAALPGAVLGFGVAAGGLAAARRLDPGALPRLEQVSVDPATFLLAVASALTLALASAGLPGVLLSGNRATRRVAAGARSASGRGLRRLWNAMIVAQVALTFSLLVGGVALTRSLMSLLDADLGFRADGVTAVQVILPASRYAEPDAVVAYFERAMEAARSLPGVAAASMADILPHVTQARISGTTNPDVESDVWAWAGVRFVDPSYFELLGIPLLRGQYPGPVEPAGALVDRTIAERLLEDGPVGARVRNGMTGGPVLVTGVVGPVREWAVEPGAIGTLYVDYRVAPSLPREAHILVRGSDGRTPAVPALRRALQALDPQVPLSIEPLEGVMARSLGSRRLVLAVVMGFGLLGLVLAALGIYGIVAYVTRRRLRESGIRLALGARPARVWVQVLVRGMIPTVAGLIVGTGLAFVLLQVAGSRIDGLEEPDPVAFAAAGLLLTSAALLAGWLPARWASRVELASVLRED